MKPTVKVKAKIDRAHIKRRTKEGTLRSLHGAGVIVQRSARKQFSSRAVKKTPKWSRVGTKDGRPVLAMQFRPPKAGKVTSWKNPRGRGATLTGFLRTLIKFDVEKSRESVVIGPTDAATWLNKLQEFGGSGRRTLKLIGISPDRRGTNRLLQKYSPPASMVGGGRGRRKGSAYVGIWVDPGHTRRRPRVALASGSARVPPGRYMEKGLAAKREKLALEWKDKIYGP